MNCDEQWIEIPATIFQEEGVIRVLESAETALLDIMHALQEGVYDKPFIIDNGVVRSLHFDFSAVQSEMLIDEPNALTFAYTRKMMAFLLFNPQPKHVAIVGLGGGSLTKFCYQQLPRTHVTTLEINKHVIGLSELFEIPPPDKFKRIIHTDAVEYFSTTEDFIDVVLVDGCDRQGTAPVFCEPSFLLSVRNRLQVHGILVMNLTGMHGKLTEIIQTVEACFSTQVLLLDVKGSRNKILFAFNSSSSTNDWPEIRRNAKTLATRHGLDFPHYARRLQRKGIPAHC
jgi:spermidine synthase